jgi:hypothetical protein
MELVNAILGSRERAIPMAIFALGFAVVAGTFRLESAERDLAQLKADHEKLSELLHTNETTWAKIAERVKIYHKE